MFQIGNTLVSSAVFEKHFKCDLKACLGACCVLGDSGAPLYPGEADEISKDLESIKPFMRQEGVRAIDQQGIAVRDSDGDWVTPLIDGKECAFVAFDERGIARCAIEDAWRAGVTHFRKPVSCHLYPIRITPYGNHDSVNYHIWKVCDAACRLGDSTKVTIFEFVREALVRKYGLEWVGEAEAIYQMWVGQQSDSRAGRERRGGRKK